MLQRYSNRNVAKLSLRHYRKRWFNFKTKPISFIHTHTVLPTYSKPLKPMCASSPSSIHSICIQVVWAGFLVMTQKAKLPDLLMSPGIVLCWFWIAFLSSRSWQSFYSFTFVWVIRIYSPSFVFQSGCSKQLQVNILGSSLSEWNQRMTFLQPFSWLVFVPPSASYIPVQRDWSLCIVCGHMYQCVIVHEYQAELVGKWPGKHVLKCPELEAGHWREQQTCQFVTRGTRRTKSAMADRGV